jgi:hypothetical protein
MDGDSSAGASRVHRVEIEFTHVTANGCRYRVTCQGLVLLESTRDPEFDACRRLLARGITGTLETFAPGGAIPRMRLDITCGATRRTLEIDRDGPRIGAWRPHPGPLLSEGSD